ncbi:MAG: methionyl-tRNA formyltransferase [Elusimicrobia bacterium]|nr:methionyl-tRNA formyltransferase [Elusimicrobiota bacterium]
MTTCRCGNASRSSGRSVAANCLAPGSPTIFRILFFGTPHAAVPFLTSLMQRTSVVAVVTQPDAPVGRSYTLTPSPVAQAAQASQGRLFRPAALDDPSLLRELEDLHPDLGILVAYGKLLPPEILRLPRLGCLNVHFSLLPRYRGAAPIAWALIRGESATGVTTFWMEPSLDSGPIVAQRSLPIAPEDTAISLEKRLVALGIEVLEDTLRLVETGQGKGQPQVGEPSWAPKLTPTMAQIDWMKPASDIVNLIRGLAAGPEAFTWIPRQQKAPMRLKILSALVTHSRREEDLPSGPTPAPGQVVSLEPRVGFVVQCHPGLLTVQQVQPEGKPVMSAWNFWQGARLSGGVVLQAPPSSGGETISSGGKS